MNTILDNTFYQFGTKSLIAKMVKGLLLSLLFVAFFIFLLFVQDTEIIVWLNSATGVSVGNWLVGIAGSVAVGSILVQMISAWISYATTSFMVSQDSLSLKSGFLTKKENSFPLRNINNVSHHQGIIDQIFGVGTCIVEMASDETDASHADNIILDDMDESLGRALSAVLIERANTQRVSMATPAVNVPLKQ